MGINFNYQPVFRPLMADIQLNSSFEKSIAFGNTPNADTVQISNPRHLTSEFIIKKFTVANPEIKRILASVNTPLILNMGDLPQILDVHGKDTEKIARGIISCLPFSLSSKTDISAIGQAAYLHDIGKVFIPKEILNKKGKLNNKEVEIMHKHSELGYELLKNSGLSPNVLMLIRNHHQNVKKNGYPRVDNRFFADINLQILSIADKYSALIEKRPYKEPFSREEALTIIAADVNEGLINPLVFNALVKYSKLQ